MATVQIGTRKLEEFEITILTDAIRLYHASMKRKANSSPDNVAKIYNEMVNHADNLTRDLFKK